MYIATKVNYLYVQAKCLLVEADAFTASEMAASCVGCRAPMRYGLWAVDVR